MVSQNIQNLNSKIRLIHIIHSLAMGGAENGVVNLMNHINKEIFEPIIIAFVNNGPLTSRLDRNHVRIIEMDKKEGNDFLLPIKLCSIFRQIRPHIVHTHSWGTLVEGVLAARFARVPVVIHGEHGTIEEKKSNIIVQRFFWGLSNIVVSISSSLKDKLNEKVSFNASRIIPIINGVDTQRFKPEQNNNNRAKFNIPKDAFVIGTVGRLVPVKDQGTFIDAISIIKKKHPDEKVMGIIVGEGPLYEKLKEKSKFLGIENNILMLGKQDDIPTILNLFDIFVLPSISEGISNTILEAMSCGLPIIATKVGGTIEILSHEKEGILIPPRDKNRLAAAILSVLYDKDLREQYGRKSRKAAMTKFGLLGMVKTYEDIYIRFLRQKGSIFG